MKKTIILLAAAVAFCSCQINFGNGIKGIHTLTVRCNGEVQEKTYDLKDFNEIMVKGQANVKFAQAESFLVSVKANEEVFEYLELEVNDGELVISTQNGVNILAKTYEVMVTAPLLTDVTVSGAADLDLTDGYTADEDLDIDVNGAGDLQLVGVSVPSMDITINGAGDLDVVNAKVKELDVTVNGAGDVSIDNVTAGSVSITTRGAGAVKISGTADQADYHVAGAGSVDARYLKCESTTTAKHGAASIKL